MTSPGSAEEGDRPGARTLRIAGKRRAALPPPSSLTPAAPPTPLVQDGSTVGAAPVAVEDGSHTDLASKAAAGIAGNQPSEPSQAQDSQALGETSMQRFLADPRDAIAAMYAEHPDFKLDKNTNYALPVALRDSIERKSKKLGVPIKQIVAALLLAALESWNEPIETWR